jgi:hypothetical protein
MSHNQPERIRGKPKIIDDGRIFLLEALPETSSISFYRKNIKGKK